ncbi:MAG TPA: hypothetical protein VGF46_13460 [Gaiellales bacterium]|jgi:hypothetical protein
MAVSDGKGAGGALMEVMTPGALLIAAAIAIPGMAITLALVIWAIAST